MSTHDGFRRGQPTFHCATCNRLTRKTNNTGGHCCPECDKAAMIENGISDEDLTGSDLASAEAEILALNRRAVKKGGVITGKTS
jgi:DNA-directed RNA polymerase subunit RPC12/RpoP